MSIIGLTDREQLIERVLHLSDAEVKQMLALMEDMHDGSEDEIRADNEHWDRQFAESQDQLGQLGAEALAEYHAGKTRPFAS